MPGDGEGRAVSSLHLFHGQRQLPSWGNARVGDRQGRGDNGGGRTGGTAVKLEGFLPIGKKVGVRRTLRYWREGLRAGLEVLGAVL